VVKVYTDLDSLFDTRATLLSAIDDIDIKQYLTRDNDNFDNIGEATFKLLYSRRDRDLLRASDTTPVKEILVSVIMDIKATHVATGHSDDITLSVNHYPYLLNDDDKSGILTMLRNKFNDRIEYELVYRSPRELDLLSYSAFVSYDAMSIANEMINKSKLKDNPLPDVIMVLPALLPQGMSNADKDKYFLGLMEALRGFIDIQFVNITHFCSVTLIDEYNSGEQHGTN